MILKVVLAIALSQAVRSKVDDRDPNSQCLWWPENSEIPLRISSAGNAETPGDTEFTAIVAAMRTWQTQLDGCSSLRLFEGPRTETRRIGFYEGQDNEFVVVFRQQRCADVVPPSDPCRGEADNCGSQFDCWQHQEAAIAITTTSYNPETGRILDSDIEFNTPAFIFSTVDSPPCLGGNFNTGCVATDVQNTTTHELGHLLGLGHSPGAGSTMSFRANPGELSKRVLDADSARFVCDVYPKGKPSKSCLLKSVSSELGASQEGCSAAPGALVLAMAMLLLRKRRK